jgi:hypothetical protein
MSAKMRGLDERAIERVTKLLDRRREDITQEIKALTSEGIRLHTMVIAYEAKCAAD